MLGQRRQGHKGVIMKVRGFKELKERGFRGVEVN